MNAWQTHPNYNKRSRISTLHCTIAEYALWLSEHPAPDTPQERHAYALRAKSLRRWMRELLDIPYPHSK